MSLKRHLYALLGFLNLFSGVFFLLLFFGTQKLLYIALDRHLLEDVASFQRRYFEDGDGSLQPHFYVIRNPSGLVIEANNPDLIPPPTPEQKPISYNHGERTYRVLTIRTNQDLSLQYGIDITQELELLRLIAILLFAGWLTLTIIITSGYILFVRKVFGQFQRAVDSALEGREENTYREIEPLVKSLSKTIFQLKGVSSHQRDLLMALSHSIKTPISRMLLQLEQISRKVRDKRLETIRRELYMLERKVNTFLTISKLEAGLYTDEKTICNLKEIFGSLLGLYGSRLEVELEEVHLECDPNIALEVFGLLLDNAFRHGLENSTVYVRLKTHSLFIENLSQKPLGVKSGGVGLYIAKRLCESQGWKILMEQEALEDIYMIRTTLTFR
ncbi:MAG: HAMP domain-containing histidine kinase [Aquificaceae bacterium]|nr:HAMP domain-containing histidine kinase [Aquificaceae bacterium]